MGQPELIIKVLIRIGQDRDNVQEEILQVNKLMIFESKVVCRKKFSM